MSDIPSREEVEAAISCFSESVDRLNDGSGTPDDGVAMVTFGSVLARFADAMLNPPKHIADLIAWNTKFVDQEPVADMWFAEIGRHYVRFLTAPASS